jgi:2-haloacid dehalogenase
LIAAYHTSWHDMVPGEIQGTRALLEALRKSGLPLYAITNFSSEKFAETRHRFPFLKSVFLDIVVSGDEKLVKPVPRIYEILFRRNALDARNCLFIDDSLVNVEAARRVGLTAHHFKGADGLREALAGLGLPTGVH